MLFVTHGDSEAILLGDKIVGMRPRSARDQTIIPILSGKRNRADPGYARKMPGLSGNSGSRPT